MHHFFGYAIPLSTRMYVIDNDEKVTEGKSVVLTKLAGAVIRNLTSVLCLLARSLANTVHNQICPLMSTLFIAFFFASKTSNAIFVSIK